MDENSPYRLPFTLPKTDRASATDENNFSSLRAIHKEMGRIMEELLTINALTLNEDQLTVKEQLAANQKAYDILSPLHQTLENTLNEIDNNWKQRRL